MSDKLIIRNLTVSVENQKILNNIDFKLEKGKVAVIFGPNGSGKTTFLKTIMGLGNYKIESGEIFYKNFFLNSLTIDQRARLGIGICHQRIPKVSGVTLGQIASYFGYGEKSEIIGKYRMASFLKENLNDSLSGGEMKRSELMQLRMQEPDLLLLDEPDSGVDVDNIKILGEEIKNFIKNGKSAILITHSGKILGHIKKVMTAYLMIDGQIVHKGEAKEILKEINIRGYKKYSKK